MIAGGIGLLSCKSWARILTLVMGCTGIAEHTYRDSQGCLYHLGSRAAGDDFPLCQRLPGRFRDTIKKHNISAAGKMIIFVVSNRMNYGRRQEDHFFHVQGKQELPSSQTGNQRYFSFLFLGAKIGIIGLNGSGKSTLLKIIAGIEKEYQG